jgi:hypothetical protein
MQLELFKGVRKRGHLTPKEFALQCSFVDLVRRTISKEWRFTHLPMGEKRSPSTAGRLKAMGVTRGWPDFMFVGPRCVLFLELKREGSGRLSEEQDNMRTHLMRCGFPYLLTSSFDDAVATLQDYNILPSGIRVQ